MNFLIASSIVESPLNLHGEVLFHVPFCFSLLRLLIVFV